MRRIPTAGLAVLAIAIAGGYLLGLFAIGPYLSRRHVPRVSVVQLPAQRPTTHTSPTPIRTTLLTAPAAPLRPQVAMPPPKAPPIQDETQPTPVAPSDESIPSPPIINAPTADQTSASHKYRVQAGRFPDQADADNLAAQLASAGFTASVHRTESATGVAFAVSAGVFTRRTDADALASALREKGFSAALIPFD